MRAAVLLELDGRLSWDEWLLFAGCAAFALFTIGQTTGCAVPADAEDGRFADCALICWARPGGNGFSGGAVIVALRGGIGGGTGEGVFAFSGC